MKLAQHRLVAFFLRLVLIVASMVCETQAQAPNDLATLARSKDSHQPSATPRGGSTQSSMRFTRSFQDSNGDGVGDLNGITRRFEYLKELGIDAIWLTPFFPSPQVDFGNDTPTTRASIRSMALWPTSTRLVREAKKRIIGIIVDVVPNLTSEQLQ